MKKMVYTIGAGLIGTAIGFYMSGELGAIIGAIVGVVNGFALSTLEKIPR